MPEEVLKVSASAIKSYLDCRYRFARDHVDRLSDAERAQTPALTFGNSVHRALAQYLRRGGKACNTGSDLIGILKEVWDSRGYADTDEEQSYVRRGMAAMRTVWMADHPPASADILGVERWAEWPRPHHGILARDRLDVVYRMPNRTVVAMDWKSGEHPISAEDLPNDPQAWFIRTLSAATFPGFDRAEGIRVMFRYIEVGQSVEVNFEKEDFDEATGRILDVARAIREAKTQHAAGASLDEAFPRRVSRHCQACPMRRHCHSDNQIGHWR